MPEKNRIFSSLKELKISYKFLTFFEKIKYIKPSTNKRKPMLKSKYLSKKYLIKKEKITVTGDIKNGKYD